MARPRSRAAPMRRRRRIWVSGVRRRRTTWIGRCSAASVCGGEGGGGGGGGSKNRGKRVRDRRVAYCINPHTTRTSHTLHTTTIPPTANSTARFTAHYIQHTTYNAPAPAPLASARAPTRRRGGPRRRRPNRDSGHRSWREVSQWMGRRGRRTRWWKEGRVVGGRRRLVSHYGFEQTAFKAPLTTRPTLSLS